MVKFLQLAFQGMALGSVYSLIALGFVIVFKGSGVFNFAHGDLVMASAFFVVAGPDLPWGVKVVLAVVIMVAIAVLSERVLLRPMHGRSLFAVVLVTLGLSIVVRALLGMLFGLHERGSTEGPMGKDVFTVGDVILPRVGLWTIATSALLMAALWVLFQRTRAGLAMRATAASREAAMAQGIDIRRTFALSWAVAGVLAVAAAIFLGAFPRHVDREMSATALGAMPAIIIGGFDSLSGAVVGGMTVGLIQVLGAGYLADFGNGTFHQVLPYLVMLTILLVRPYGLFGSPEIERV